MRTRQRLLDAAEQVFGQEGYREASVFDITEAADVSKRTFYLHFTDKEAVIEALAMRRFEELRAMVEEKNHGVESGAMPFRDEFQHTTQIIFEYAAQHPDLMQIIFGQGGSFRLQAMTREFMVRAWEENMTEHCECRADALVPLNVLANAISGVVHQMLCWWIKNPNDYAAATMAEMCTAVLFDNIEINFDHVHFGQKVMSSQGEHT